ncbi:DUF4422 domain-containing protein [Marinomonas sp. GJ51-6]|uniref:DUF4422 domain-containing protein n=1 Tax=Marinomonas sp. GJ51-6 TaxID=2992802 RepID=UPI0029346463|nr:DUF4422 domain-containing protein [Marinomonas sp. GJ51-6]WOD06223.1 DUF4422 domain-containing protein [Marinomonas sp. GJ51-6]
MKWFNDNLSENVIVVPKRRVYKKNIVEIYGERHFLEDVYSVLNIVENLYPDYRESIIKFKETRFLYCYNMFISNAYVFLEYLDWLFSVLFLLEKNIDLDKNLGYQERVFGFLSERLFTLWLLHNSKKYKIIEMDVLTIMGAKC